MANFIKPYNDDPFVGHLATPITSSSVTRALLKNLPAYRQGLSPSLRGLEVGLAHGYFLIGPFSKLGPLRNSDIGLLAGFLSTIGLILILTLGLTIYGAAVFKTNKISDVENLNGLQNKKAWETPYEQQNCNKHTAPQTQVTPPPPPSPPLLLLLLSLLSLLLLMLLLL